MFKRSQKSKPQLVYRGYVYNKKISYGNGNTNWRCSDFVKFKCHATCLTKDNKVMRCRLEHKHPPPDLLVNKQKLYHTLTELALCENINLDNDRSAE